jgi:hypothetical protein
LIQHATFDVPRYDQGYCLDDNARALLLMTLMEETSTAPSRQARARDARYLAFVAYAFNRTRALSQLHVVLAALGGRRGLRGQPRPGRLGAGHRDRSFGRARPAGSGARAISRCLPPLAAVLEPRAWAYSLLGINEYFAVHCAVTARCRRSANAGSTSCVLCTRFHATPEWPWFEDFLTYANARLPQALIASG